MTTKYQFAYHAISRFYGERRARRSGVRYMNHIDEGLLVIRTLCDMKLMSREDWSTAAITFMLHPLFQTDADLARTMRDVTLFEEISRIDLIRILEYRYRANAYLSHRKINDISEIELSLDTPVNIALIADKIQNYKDFILHHQATHERSVELTEYFENWLKRLNITDFHTYWFPLLQEEIIRE